MYPSYNSQNLQPSPTHSKANSILTQQNKSLFKTNQTNSQSSHNQLTPSNKTGGFKSSNILETQYLSHAPSTNNLNQSKKPVKPLSTFQQNTRLEVPMMDSGRSNKKTIQSPNFGKPFSPTIDKYNRTDFSENFSDISASNISISAADFPYKNRELPFDREKYGLRLVDQQFKFFANDGYGNGVEKNTKRFKLSCLKDKSPLFDNEFLQIGMTTHPFFDYVARRAMLKTVLYFGNKTTHLVNSLEVSFSGDRNTQCARPPPQHSRGLGLFVAKADSKRTGCAKKAVCFSQWV